jgi:hypothetical protein
MVGLLDNQNTLSGPTMLETGRFARDAGFRGVANFIRLRGPTVQYVPKFRSPIPSPSFYPPLVKGPGV